MLDPVPALHARDRFVSWFELTADHEDFAADEPTWDWRPAAAQGQDSDELDAASGLVWGILASLLLWLPLVVLIIVCIA